MCMCDSSFGQQFFVVGSTKDHIKLIVVEAGSAAEVKLNCE